jgi:hypothetical protein
MTLDERRSAEAAESPAQNPYAPPADDTTAREDGPVGDVEVAFETERRSWLVCAALTLVTLGVYPSVWLWRRQPFLDGLGTTSQVGAWRPALVLLGTVATLACAFFDGLVGVPRDVERLITGVAGIATIMCEFRVATVLRSAFRGTGRRIDVSYVLTFIFGILYLQHLINRGAATPATIEMWRPRKR